MKKQLLTLLLGVITFGTFAQVPSYVPTNGLVGYWPFDGNAQDASGNGNHGTVNGATSTTDRNGNSNNAYSFDGVDDFIEILSSSSINFGIQSMTIQLWIKESGNNNNFNGLVCKMDVNGDGYQFVLSNNKLRSEWGQSSAGYGIDLIGNIYLNDNNWHLVTLVVDRQLNALKFYNNNNLDNSINESTIYLADINNLSNLFFGKDRTSVFYFKGIIDDIGIWNRALTQQEITTLYNGCTTPIATITPQGNTTFCQGGSLVLNAATGTGYTYEWYKDGSIVTGATASSYSATQSGNYTVKVINGSCNATSSATAVTVNPTPTATITAGGAITFCQGGSVNLTASSATNNIYQWYNNGNSIINATSSVYSATQSGNYTVKVTNGACNATSSATVVTVHTNPTVTFSTLASYTDYHRLPITLVASPAGGTFSGPGVSGVLFNPSLAGLGKKIVTYNYINANNCSGSASQSTIVNDTLGIVCTAYDTISVTDTLFITTTLGLTNPTTNTLKIYPNPAKDHLTINNGNFASMSNYSIRIDNALGQQVFSSVINQPSFYIDLSTWSGDGVYFVYLKDAQGTIKETRKIVLQ